MKTLYVVWQDQESRQWHPVGVLTQEDNIYVFSYTNGARLSKKFVPFGRMQDIEGRYISEKLFPIFLNRILPRNRPEYPEYVNWSGLDVNTVSDFQILSRTGGLRATDHIQIHSAPEKTEDGKYRVFFFCHGIRHMDPAAATRVEFLAVGSQLYPMLDTQNDFDANAIALRTGDPAVMIGYIPRFYAKDIGDLIKTDQSEVNILIERLNISAPIQMRVMCRAEADWPEMFTPCTDDSYTPIGSKEYRGL